MRFCRSTPGVADTSLTDDYDDADRRETLSATIDGTADFKNTYTYTGRSLLDTITQESNGGDAVDYKWLDLDYNIEDQLTAVKRYASSGTGDMVASSTFSYDGTGRLTDLTYKDGAGTPATLADYNWAFDTANRVTQFGSLADGADEENPAVAGYQYDDFGQPSECREAFVDVAWAAIQPRRFCAQRFATRSCPFRKIAGVAQRQEDRPVDGCPLTVAG